MAEYVQQYDMDIQQGDDRAFTFPVRDAQGQPMNLAGYSARADVRARYGSTTALHTWSTTDGTATITGGNVVLSVATSEQWTWRFGVYDLHLIDPQGQTEVLARGTVRVVPGVTRAGA